MYEQYIPNISQIAKLPNMCKKTNDLSTLKFADVQSYKNLYSRCHVICSYHSKIHFFLKYNKRPVFNLVSKVKDKIYILLYVTVC